MNTRLTAAILAIVVIASVTAVLIIQFNNSSNTSNIINFYVLSDSQGYQGGIEQITSIANEHSPDFVFHCGDLTPFGQEHQYNAVIDTLDDLTVPLYTTPGNHDIRLGGGKRYIEHFGSPNYSFDIGPAHFVAFNTSAADITEQDYIWLENDLSESTANWKFVFTHIPPFDPRTEKDHTLINSTSATRLMSLFHDTGVNTVFSGHIHIYNQTIHDGVRYVISGGAGANLVAKPEMGGIYHFINVTIHESNLIIEPVELTPPILQRDSVLLIGSNEHMTLTINDLLLIESAEGFSSFQNQLGNWRGQGVYRGVKVSFLIELIGGMNSTGTVRVASDDGFQQNYCYGNVYPNESWFEIQGHMILAYEYNKSLVPQWEDGLRLVMLPPDGTYSNEDCIVTSAPEMGCQIYNSAGARWVRWVNIIEVISG